MDISVSLIKKAKYQIGIQLVHTFITNAEGQKIILIFPIDKGGFKLNLHNYRPFFILSLINKAFETILHKRVIV